MSKLEQQLKALEFFKDWSNYLLLTTVAALGWCGSTESGLADSPVRWWCIWAFALSIVFGIFTLGLTPVVAEEMREEIGSIYYAKGHFSFFWLWGKEIGMRLKTVCWPQHLLFLAGIILYAAAKA